MQWVPGENRPHRVCDAGARVCVSPQLFLLLCMWQTAEERGWVCTERRTAAVQERLWEGERPPQPRWLRFRYEYRLIYTPQTLMPAYSWIYFQGSFRRNYCSVQHRRRCFEECFNCFLFIQWMPKHLLLLYGQKILGTFFEIYYSLFYREKKK